MVEQVIKFNPHGLDSPEVRARIAEGDADIQARLARINQRITPHFGRVKARINALVRSKRNADYCIPAFWAIADEMMAFNRDDVACRRGCNHCCHTQVFLTTDEAEVIGKRIGRKPQHVAAPGRGRDDRESFDFGYHNPCTFLIDGECSIYENRPLPCRLQYSLDVDALMCELTPPESKAVPYLNPHPYLMAFLQMLGVPEVRPVLGDIRDFWPVTK